jgi:tRNA uridine 5-carbamoylmethylation protein Kti12
MLKTCICIILTVLLGCSQDKNKPDENSLSQKLKRRNTTYNKIDVLLAIKYNLDESVIKAISESIKGEMYLQKVESGGYVMQVDTNYALTVRRTIETTSKEYKITPNLIVSILIDRELLELNETLPSSVGEEVTERLAPSER